MSPFGAEGRPHILIAGCGYVGQRLAARLRDRYEVTALVRSNEKAASALERLGLEDRRSSTWIGLRMGAEHPRASLIRKPSFISLRRPARARGELRVDRFLHLAFVPPKSFVYMSTTGVYGDTRGALVDESIARSCRRTELCPTAGERRRDDLRVVVP